MTFIELYETLRTNTDWEEWPWKINIPSGVIADMIEDLTDAQPIPDKFGELLRSTGLCTYPQDVTGSDDYRVVVTFHQTSWYAKKVWIRHGFLILPVKDTVWPEPKGLHFIGWKEKS